MSKRPSLQVTAPDFGAWLRTLRGERSHERIAQLLRPYVADLDMPVSKTTVLRYERGTIPNWPALLALPLIFRRDPDEVLARLRDAVKFNGSEMLRERLVLLRSRLQPSGGGATGGAPTTPTALEARIRELEADNAALRAEIQYYRDWAAENCDRAQAALAVARAAARPARAIRTARGEGAAGGI